MKIDDNEFDAAAGQVAGVGKITDPLDNAAAKIVQGQRTQLRSSLYSSLLANPDVAARATALGRKTGIPADLVERNLPEVERDVQLNEFDKLLNDSPKLAAYLGVPQNAKVAHDDVAALTGIEATIGVIRGPEASFGSVVKGLAKSLPIGARMAREGMRMQFADLFGFEDMRKDAERKYSQASLESDVNRPEFESDTARAVYGGGESVIRMAPGLAASLATRTTGPMLATMGVQTEAEAYGKYRTRGGTPMESLVGGAGEGAVEVATELLPMAFLVKNFGRAGAGSFLTGLAAREIPSEQVATLVQDALDTAIANPDKTWAQYAQERPGAAYQTLIATITQAGVMAGANSVASRFAGRDQQAAAAEQNAGALEQLAALAEASKLRERDPDSFQSFVKQAMEDGPVQDVYLNAATLAQSGVDIGALAQASPAIAAQLNEALTAGGDIRIPVEEFVTRIVGTEFAQPLLQHLKTDPAGMTQAEAQTYMQERAGELQAEVEKTLAAKQDDDAFKASRDEVAGQVLAQLKTAGRFSDEVNNAYATMMGNFYAVTAAKLGMTPTEMARRYPLQVRAERLAGAKTLDQQDGQDEHAAIRFTTQQEADAYLRDKKITKTHRSDNTGRDTYSIRPRKPAGDWRAAVAQREAALEAAIGRANQNATERAEGNTLDQGEPGARGSITLGADITQTPSVITLLAKADLSTFLHESGHFFLEVMNDIASRPDAPVEVVADMAAVLKWFGVPDLATWDSYDIEQKREYHEQFARGFEAYLFEGKTPNAELAGLFGRFRAWMLNVYRSLAALNVTLTDDVRSVFDRMLASNEAIAEAEALRGYGGLFETQPEGMSDDQWRQYRDDTVGATQDAIRNLETRSLRDMQWLTNAKAKLLAKMQREAKTKRAEVRAQVELEVMAEPINQARSFITRGELLDVDRSNKQRRILEDVSMRGTKLSLPALKEMYGEGPAAPWRYMPTGEYGMVGTEGMHPDTLAELFGFESGDQLVRELLAAEKPAEKIEGITDQRMLEQYGDLTDPAAISRAADVALHNDMRLRAIATEMNALHKAAGNRTVLAKAAKLFAEATVARTKASDLKPNRFTAAATRAAKAADAAFKKGDLATAAQEKQNQLVNTYAAKAAYEAVEEIRKTAERFRKMTTGKDEDVAKKRDMDMVQATRAILAEYGIGTRGKKALEYLKAVEANDPGMYAILRERVDAATENAKPFTELTVEEMRALRDEVESLWFLARRSRQMEVDGDLMDRQDIEDELRARLNDIGVPLTAPGEGRAITEDEVKLSMMQSWRAAARRVESWVGAKDGSAAMGPFRKYIWNSIKDPADAYRADKAKYLKQYRELLDQVAPSLAQAKIAAPELGYTFGFDKGGMGKVELLHAILHTGNEGNKKKLLVGRKWGTENADGTVDTTNWDAFINRMIAEGRLTKADFDFAQGVWDLMESLKPAAQKAHRDVFGRYFDEVTATPFTTPFGSYRGGYVPAIADSRIVSDAKTRALAEEENASLQLAFPATSKGFTKGRVDYNKPLLLDLRSLSQHIDKVLLFSHLEQPIRDVRRVLTSKGVAYALNRIDPAAFDGLLTPWLNRTARQQVETAVAGSNGLMRFFSVVRQRAGMAAMFANVSNTAQQITGLSIALLKVKPKYLLPAVVDFIGSPRKMADAVADASPYMAMRMENEVAAMNDAINEILLNPSLYESAKAWTAKHTYFMQSAVDNVLSPMIWHGAYNQAMETAPAGMTDDQLKTYARRLADSAVRETQGSTLPEDVSRIETGTSFVRLFTQFAGYFNMQANVIGTELAKVSQDVGLRQGAGRGLYVLLFGFFAPAWVATAIALAFRGGPEDEDKDGSYLDDWLAHTFGWGTLRSATAMVPVVGQTTNSLANTFNKKPYDDKISTSPAISMIESAVSAPSSVYKAITTDGKPTKAIRDVATLISMTVGVPANAVAKPINYLTGVANDDVRPTGPVDAARGVVSGVASPESKR